MRRLFGSVPPLSFLTFFSLPISMLNLKDLDQQDAVLLQAGLKALGYYNGTTRGVPGPMTKRAYNRYLSKSKKSKSFAEVLAQMAESQVGEREKGNNGGRAVRMYQSATWLTPGAWPWCAAFVCWCFKEAIKELPQAMQRPRTAGAWDFENWARKEGAELIKPAGKTKVRRGDILVYSFSHIGIAVSDEWQNSEIDTVEGNTNAEGAREGDGVYRKTRNKSQVRSIIRL
jgi:hypothetical protein